VKLTRYFGILVTAFFMVLLILFPEVYMGAVADGFKLFVRAVLPAMFPFFFFTKLLTSLGGADGLAKLMKKPMKHMFNAPPIGGYVLIMSLLSGYPVGAKITADSYENGLISRAEAKGIIAFSSTSGPLFILGTVAVGFLNNYLAGLIILLTHFAGAILNGILFKPKSPPLSELKPLTPKSYDGVLSEAVNSGVFAVAVAGGLIAVFGMVTVFLQHAQILNFAQEILSKIGVKKEVSSGVLVGLIEVTRGALFLSEIGNLRLVVPLLSALISFGGLSVILQSSAFLSKCKIKFRYIFLTKISQAFISFCLAYAVCFFVF